MGEETLDDDEHKKDMLISEEAQEELLDMMGLKALYKPGVDREGRPVFVFVMKHIPVEQIDMRRALLYVISLMDPVEDVTSSCL